MAIAALVCAVVFAPLGIILGHIARSQIKRSGEGGRGIATAALVLGYLFTIGSIVVTVVAIAIVVYTVDHHRYDQEPIYDGPSAFQPPPSHDTHR